jgi:hypothetical protein
MGKCCESGIAGQYTGKKSSGTFNTRQISDTLIKTIAVSFLYMCLVLNHKRTILNAVCLSGLIYHKI